ncbi:MAG: hypothetical protein ACYCQL_02890 [Acidithiobacillus sp.]
MSEHAHTLYSRLLARILTGAYAAHPWRGDGGETIPQDVALDASGALPVWWSQIEKTAALLDIPADHLPAMIVDDPQSMTGRKLVWRDVENLLSADQYLLRAVLPALAMDALHVLHQQENILVQPRHLGMFPDQNALTKNLTENLPISLVIAPITGQQEDVLPNEAAGQRRTDDDPVPSPGGAPSPEGTLSEEHPTIH